MCIPIARQQVSKHILQLDSIGFCNIRTRDNRRQPLLGNGPVNTHPYQQKTVFSMGTILRGYKRAHSVDTMEYKSYNRCTRVKWRIELWDANLQGYELGSRGIEWSQVFGTVSHRIWTRRGNRWSKEYFVWFEVKARVLWHIRCQEKTSEDWES
jgi:hypothetical protein